MTKRKYRMLTTIQVGLLAALTVSFTGSAIEMCKLGVLNIWIWDRLTMVIFAFLIASLTYKENNNND